MEPSYFMSYSASKRYRSNRADPIGLPPGLIGKTWTALQRGPVLMRLGVCLLAAAAMWLVTGAWAPSFSYRTGYVPPRDVITRVNFEVENPEKTNEARQARKRELPHVYNNNPKQLEEVREELKNKLFEVLKAPSFEDIPEALKTEFQVAMAPGTPTTPAAESPMTSEAYSHCRLALDEDKDLAAFDFALKATFLSLEKNGLLDKLTHDAKEGSQASLLVAPLGRDHWTHQVNIDEVRLDSIRPQIGTKFTEAFRGSTLTPEQAAAVSRFVTPWLQKKLPVTLTYNPTMSAKETERALAEMKPEMDVYMKGASRLAEQGKPLRTDEVELLSKEYTAWRKTLTWAQMLRHSAASFGMYFAMFTLCGFYIYHRRPKILENIRIYLTLLALAVAVVALCWFSSADQWRAEIIPLLLFGMTVAIAFEKELALLLSACVSLVVAFSLEQGLAEFVILVSSVAAAIQLLGRVRSRTKLIYVGAFSGLVVALTTFGVGTLIGQTFGVTDLKLVAQILQWLQLNDASFFTALLCGAAWFGACSILAGVIMTGLLPFIERMFDVQTDISLLELGDIAHPLLQELVRRAPGTYNHSINVASIAESAAEAIGANGLLVRVGAYFHDIGKMLKPAYFVENQGPDGNRHETLVPQMSTLVIIAHVKDGVELARKHHLPQSIIDFIEQHHGTTLVEYFYRRAAKLCEGDPDAADIDESDFRYPGPKPQTKEAAVLMLSDVVESASRALSDPTPARIEGLVHDMGRKRLLDGQFDECGLTLQDLRLIEESLVKSLTAVYHGRVKYPEHQTV